jgi:molybdopterin converting factor small subunit
MPTISIPSALRSYVDGKAEVLVEGETVGDAMQDLVTQYPLFKQHIYKHDGSLREFVNLFLYEQNVKNIRGMETYLEPSDTIKLIPSIAGG